MNSNIKEQPLMTEEEFTEYIRENNPTNRFNEKGLLSFRNFYAIGKFRSSRRAIRRGLCTPDGTIVPKRPYHNRANTSKRKGVHSREINEIKKDIYGEYLQLRANGEL